MSKPLLVLPPSPPRWPAIEALLENETPDPLSDLRARLTEPTEGANDAFAVQPDGAHVRAFGGLRRKLDVGVLGHFFTAPTHRQRGLARQLMQTLLSWFDMTGGKWLYACCPAALYSSFLEHFGFRVLHARPDDPDAPLFLLRTQAHVRGLPIEQGGTPDVRELSRADWPLIVALLQHRPGPDPRVSQAESALAAEATAHDLLAQAARGQCALLGAGGAAYLSALASLATDQLGQRSYAMILPHGDPHANLRAAVLSLAAAKGYEQVDFPLEAVGSTGAATT